MVTEVALGKKPKYSEDVAAAALRAVLRQSAPAPVEPVAAATAPGKRKKKKNADNAAKIGSDPGASSLCQI
jgi:hypothetical protein